MMRALRVGRLFSTAVLAFGGSILVATIGYGQTNNSYPMLMSLKPTACQVGGVTEHELHARYNLAGASIVVVSGEGVTGEIVPLETEKPEDKGRNDILDSRCKIRFTVASDAIPGVRDFRVYTPHGASTIGQLVVGRDPVVSEKADNDTIEKAQVVSLPATLCGAIEKAEDLDFYRFSVEAGQKISFHVQSQRLMNRLHDMQTRIDPRITLKSGTGAVIASSDNHYAGDPLLFHQFSEAGEYILEVRDVRYQGNIDWTYSIEINARPFVTHTYPMVVPVSGIATVRLEGWNLPDERNATIRIASPNSIGTSPVLGSKSGVTMATALIGETPTNAFAVFASELPTTMEAPAQGSQPATTDSSAATAAISTIQSVSFPTVLAGRIEQAGEVDRFEFEAKAQERFSFQSISRRLTSAMDPKIKLKNAQGGVISEADDATYDRVISADPNLENWTCPADGKYTLEVHDLHGRGGAEFGYAIHVAKSEPHFELEVDTDKTLLAPGMTGVVYIRALRKNGFTGDIDLHVDGLPPEVTATCGRILANGTDGCVLLHASPNAAKGMQAISFRGTSKSKVSSGEEVEWNVYGRVLQEYYQPGGGRGNYPVLQHALSIAEPMDVRSIQLSDTDIQLKPGESKKINITVERAPDYKGNVTLDVIYQHLEQPYGNSLPKGVKMDSANSKTLLATGETTGFITLKADADAPEVNEQIVPVNVHVSINFVMKHTLCGPPLKVSVRKP